MWKETIICAVIVVSIVIGNIITQRYTVESVEGLSNRLEELKVKISNIEKQEDTKDMAKEKMEEIKAEWESRHDKLAYYIEHNELETVENNLTGIKSFMETEEYPEAINELDKCIFVLKHIKEKYEFNLENIF